MMQKAEQNYLACCKFIVEVLGEDKEIGWCCGCLYKDCKVYEDEVIHSYSQN